MPLFVTTAREAGEVHPNDGTTGDLPPIGVKKRKLNEYGGEADPRRAKRPNLRVQTGANQYEFILPRKVGITDAMSELTKIGGDLRAALVENERIHIQIGDLEAIPGQITSRFHDLKDKMKRFADVI